MRTQPSFGAASDDVHDSAPASPSIIDLRSRRLRWWKEVAFVVAFYLGYTWVRNHVGSQAVSEAVALTNAERIIAIERALGSFHEEAVQQAFLSFNWFIKTLNVFYGTLHFAVTGGVLVYIYVCHRPEYPRWRTTLAWTTGLALVGFATFPLLPPRLLPDDFGFVDTLAVFGGPWSFDHGVFKEVSNQFAAMPSLHFAWAMWCAMAMWAVLPTPMVRVFAILYPLFTFATVVVTGNHYWLDALGGALIVLVAWYVSLRWYDRRRGEPAWDEG